MSDYAQLLEDYRLLDEYVSTRVSPGNKDVPLLLGNAVVDGVLTVTNGNWYGMPTSYAYAWSGAGVADGASYTVDAADAGTEISCVVTATNPAGSTAAPPSNAVAIPAAAGMARGEEGEHPTPRRAAAHENHRGRR